MKTRIKQIGCEGINEIEVCINGGRAEVFAVPLNSDEMLLFCPTCANVLVVEEASGQSSFRFACKTCPFIYSINRKVCIQ